MASREKDDDWDRRSYTRQIDKLEEKVEAHGKLLYGTDEKNGVFEEFREIRTKIERLLHNVLGEGANYSKSLMGQLEETNKALKIIQTEQIKANLALDHLEQGRATRITIRGQNIIFIAACCTFLGAVSAATINAYKESISAGASRVWERVTHLGKATHVYELPTKWIRPAPVRRRGKKVRRLPSPVAPVLPQEQPVPPEVDLSKPEPAPVTPY